jgi:hypothetical protein
MMSKMVLVYKNGEQTKKRCAQTKKTLPKKDIIEFTEFTEQTNAYLDQFKPSTLPINKNGFIHLGEHPLYEANYGKGKKLLMVGPDMKSGRSIDWDDDILTDIFPFTLGESTPSGGAHFYYIVPTSVKWDGKEKLLTNLLTDMGIKELDVRSQNGKSFCAGTLFKEEPDHKGRGYELEWDTNIHEFTEDEFNDFKYGMVRKLTKDEQKLEQLKENKPFQTQSVISDMVLFLANSPIFDMSEPHTFHQEFVNIAMLLLKYDFNREDTTLILTGLEELVKSKEGGPDAAKIVSDIYEKDYKGFAAEKFIQNLLNVPFKTKEKAK